MNRVSKAVALLSTLLPVCYAHASSDAQVYNTINAPQVIVPDQGAASRVARINDNVPCHGNPVLRALDRNQNKTISQCDFESRLKVSGGVRLSGGVVNHVIGEDSAGTGTDFHHMVTFIKDTPQASNINIETMNEISVDRATLNFDGIMNDWAEAHLGLVYWSDSFIVKNAGAQWYSRYTGGFQGKGNRLPIDEANIVIGNFSKTPLYFRLGRQYLDFGWYDKETLMSPMTQWFTQSVHDAVTFGMLDVHGLSANITGFRSVARGNTTRENNSSLGLDRPSDAVNNFTASLAYGFDYETFSLDVKADYMFDMFGVDYFDGYLGNGILGDTPTDFDPGDGNGTSIRPDARTSFGAFTLVSRFRDLDLKLQYAGALDALPKNIWSIRGGQTGNGSASYNSLDIRGARPHAWGMEVGLSLPILGRDSRLSFALHRTEQSYAGQTGDRVILSGSMVNYYIPRKRIEFKVEHNLMKHVDMMVEYLYDNDYTEDHFSSINNQESTDAPGDTFNNLPGTRNHNDMLMLSVSARFG